jgi:hypothetical protein
MPHIGFAIDTIRAGGRLDEAPSLQTAIGDRRPPEF